MLKNKKKPTINNHYISKVFLKSWLRPNKKLNKEILIAFFIEKQKFEDSGSNVFFAAEDFLYSFENDGEIDDTFEEYLQIGENAWGKLLQNIKRNKLFSNKKHLVECIFLLVGFYYRTKRNFKISEKVILKSIPDITSEDLKFLILDNISDMIELRTEELTNRIMTLVETEEDTFFTTDSPLFDLKFSKFKIDSALCAITPRHLLFISPIRSKKPILKYEKLKNNTSNSLVNFWNNQVIYETSRGWVVSTDTETNRKLISENLTLEKLKQRKKTDKVIAVFDDQTYEIPLSEIDED